MDEYINKSDLKDELLRRDFFPAIVKRSLETMPAADVVPKAVFEQLQHKYELAVAEREANVKRMIELEEETARLRSILDDYALQYGTVKDQHEVIDRVKRETAMEIFADIKKKYTEEE